MNTNQKPPRRIPSSLPKGQVVGKFTEYTEAVGFVETLINHGFPAGAIAIVGKDLRTVERVRGKMTYGRIALSGAITGSWLGLIFGFLFGGTTDPNATPAAGSTFSSVLIGAGIGMLFNLLRFSIGRNKRAFVSQSAVIASKYEVQVPSDLAAQAEKAIVEHENHAH
ncbi:MAG: general stress protein [Rhodoluna sp.]